MYVPKSETYGKMVIEARSNDAVVGKSFIVVRDTNVVRWIQEEAERTGKFESAIIRRCFETGAAIEMVKSRHTADLAAA